MHLRLCVASGNELADIFHHQRFHWIGIDLGRDCNASDVGTVKLRRPFVSSAGEEGNLVRGIPAAFTSAPVREK